MDYEQLNTELTSEITNLKNKLSNNPVIELQNCGLSIEDNEEAINKDNAYAVINGRQYYAREFIDSLLPDNVVTTMKDNMLYIGKIIKNKTSIFNLVKIKNTRYEEWDSIVDTYGNAYSNVLFLRDSGWGITYNANKEYANFKCIIAMKENSDGKGYIQIETDDTSYTYISPEINNMTNKVEVDIPINYTSTLTIKCVNGNSRCNLFISDAVLYNQE